MKQNGKLAFVQATIEYIISQLNENQRFCLIQFNQEVALLTNDLIPMSPENKKEVQSQLKEIKAHGSTNISDALFTALGIIQKRQEQNRVSSIMLFTDGHANVGLRGSKFTDALKGLAIPSGLTINTCGYGIEHDSKMLQNISFCSKGGVYYYVESVESIPAIFSECLSGLLSTIAHNIEVRFQAKEGCRIVNFYTKFPITEHTSVKDYSVSLGSMYSTESRSILFKLSLRKLNAPAESHELIKIILSYTNTISGAEEKSVLDLSVKRPVKAPVVPRPVELDKHINRYTAAAAIEEAVAQASSQNYESAKKRIIEVIQHVEQSVAAKAKDNKRVAQYCEDLVADLKECAEGLKNFEVFSSGVHYATAYSTMYYIERSTGSSNLMGILKTVDQGVGKRRHEGYGYLTTVQEEEALKARKEAAHYVSGYL